MSIKELTENFDKQFEELMECLKKRDTIWFGNEPITIGYEDWGMVLEYLNNEAPSANKQKANQRVHDAPKATLVEDYDQPVVENTRINHDWAIKTALVKDLVDVEAHNENMTKEAILVYDRLPRQFLIKVAMLQIKDPMAHISA